MVVLFRRAVKSAVKTAYTCLGLEHGTSSVEDMVMCDGCESWFTGKRKQSYIHYQTGSHSHFQEVC